MPSETQRTIFNASSGLISSVGHVTEQTGTVLRDNGGARSFGMTHVTPGRVDLWAIPMVSGGLLDIGFGDGGRGCSLVL